MADAVDITTERQPREESAILAAHRARQANTPTPVIIDGIACCADCEEPLNDVRLKIGAGRCVSCQEIAEHRGIA
ncbi:hypothetical protein [Thioalkalivibrio sp. ALJ8]|uniref:hypothetical protein n=1 Tax=Thioalkalivibrio sp. ALJ8 TaxID=1158757 RepID=UPI000376C2D9|nr:hypothetical protein [Thioalkalivibrio sp. ALJ8]